MGVVLEVKLTRLIVRVSGEVIVIKIRCEEVMGEDD